MTPFDNVSEIWNMKKKINVNIKSFSIKAKLKISIKHLKNNDKRSSGEGEYANVRAAFKQVLQASKYALTLAYSSTKINYPI